MNKSLVKNIKKYFRREYFLLFTLQAKAKAADTKYLKKKT